MKFKMPDNPAEQIKMHSIILDRVHETLRQVPADMARVTANIDNQLAQGISPLKIQTLIQTRKNLHRQELCLRDQERRLRERIELLLQTGSSTENCRPDA
jgi:hypothetical protein